MQGSTVDDNSSAHNVSPSATSDSASSYLARAMSGIVQGFDSRTGMGKIKGVDGATYRFFSAGVITAGELHIGQKVTFSESDGVASKISADIDVVSLGGSIGGLANSSSAPVAQSRVMRGVVQSFDARAGMGKIKGDDGASYRFYAAGVVSKQTLSSGQKVEFSESDGVATKVSVKRKGIWQLLFGSW